MKKIFSIILTIAAIFSIFTNSEFISKAEGASASDIQINGEYLIADKDGLHTRYVVMATNTTGEAIAVSAVFRAVSADGAPVKTVRDYADNISNGQTFILYGQFKNSDLAAASGYTYDIAVSSSKADIYDSVGIDVAASESSSLTVTGTNYSTSDANMVCVRSLFFKDGAPVAFDYVNVADSGYTLHSGSSNVQELGLVPVDYDNYVVTYTVAAGDL